MTRSIHDVLVALGARAVREGQLTLDLELLDVRSLFGGPLTGEALIEVSSPEAFAFARPRELAACGTLWLPGLEQPEDLARAILEAHEVVRARADDDQETLRRLGLKPRLLSPEPRASAALHLGGRHVELSLDDNDELIVTTVDGRAVAPENGRVSGADAVPTDELERRVGALVDRLVEGGLWASGEGFEVDVGGDDDGDDDEAGGAWRDDDDDDDDDEVPTRTLKAARAARPPPSSTQASRPLSEEQMQELAAALDDDGDDHGAPGDDDDDEPEPTLSVPGIKDAMKDTAAASEPGPHPAVRADEDDEEGGPRTVSLQTRPPSSLLAALDDEESDSADEGMDRERAPLGGWGRARAKPTAAPRVAAAAAKPRAVAAGDGDEDNAEDPTVNASAAALASPPSTLALESIEQAPRMPPPGPGESAGAVEDFSLQDEPTRAVETSASVIAEQQAPPIPPPRPRSLLGVDDFPALPEDAPIADPAPTAVNGPGDMPTRRPTWAGLPRRVRTSDEDVEAVANGFDDGEGALRMAPGRARTVRTTRIAEPRTAVIPTRATISHPVVAPLADAAPPPAAGAVGERDEAPADARPAAAASEDEARPAPVSAPDAVAAAPNAPPVVPGAPVALDTFPLDDDGDAKTRAVFVSPPLRARRPADEDQRQPADSARGATPNDGRVDTDRGGGDDADALEARAAALEEEARALRERARGLRAGHAGSAAAGDAHRPVGVDDSQLPSSASLPILASREVQSLWSEQGAAPGGAEVGGERAVPVDPSRSIVVGHRAEGGGADALAHARGAAPAPPVDTRGDAADDDGVSLAEVQAALGDLAALTGEATQVGALGDARFSELRSNSGDDVFESAAPAAPSLRRRAPLSEEAPPTRVREVDGRDGAAALADLRARAASAAKPDVDAAPPAEMSSAPDVEAAVDRASLGVIGLVVEDAKARDRLKKHLSPRFKQLVEAESASAAASLPELAALDALVFVRPRPDAFTREGLAQLFEVAHADGDGGRPGSPRILVISSDARFDDFPQVSLRLPLGQRASEVAQQVLDGLRTLGVEALDGSSEGG